MFFCSISFQLLPLDSPVWVVQLYPPCIYGIFLFKCSSFRRIYFDRSVATG